MDKYYFAALFAAFGSRSAEIAEAAAKFKSPAEAYMAPPEAWAEAGIDEKTVNKFIARRDFNYPAWLKDFCLNNGVTILTPEDNAYPYSLKQIASPPQVLYVKGSLPDLRGSIGIVGSREASGYGLKAADAFAADLAAAGVVIVSGGAKGIDTAAHRGALAAGGIFYAFAKQRQKKQAEKEALDPDANYPEDKGDFEIPVEDEPEETGEEDTEPI